MKKIYIECSEHEMETIKNVLSTNCIFKQGTIKKCGEDSDCHDCVEENIEFNIYESEGE